MPVDFSRNVPIGREFPRVTAGLLFQYVATDQPHQGMTLGGGSVTAAGAGNIYQEKRD